MICVLLCLSVPCSVPRLVMKVNGWECGRVRGNREVVMFLTFSVLEHLIFLLCSCRSVQSHTLQDSAR